MSDIKINNTTYREEDIALNWGVEFVKAILDEHRGKDAIDHPDGSITVKKLGGDVTELINSALMGVDNVRAELNDLDVGFRNSRVAYKVFQIKSGETFIIKPEMLLVVLPYGGKTIGVHKADGSELISGNVGFTICISPEINTGEYATGNNHRVGFFYQPQSVIATLSSYHDLIDCGAYFKNNGDGNMYVFAVMREVDAT